MFENYVFPSNKRLEKFPLIDIQGDANDFIIWLSEHPEIDPRVPPVYQDFIITHRRTSDVYEIFTHYNDDMTAFIFRCRVNGLKIIEGHVDYNEVSGSTIRVRFGNVSKKAKELYNDEWLDTLPICTAKLIIAMQAYMLYFKPEIVNQIYDPPSPNEQKTSKVKKRVTAQPIHMRKTKVKRIVLAKDDRPKKNINYRKLSWSVRGHYRRMGKEKKLKYIQPYICNRGGKKYHKEKRTYIIDK